MCLSILGIVAAEKHPGVCVVQLHADAAGGVAVAPRVDELHPRVVGDAWTPAVRVGADIAILERKSAKRQYLIL